MRTRSTILAVIAVALLALPATATTITWYSDETAFVGLTATWDVMEDFEDEAGLLATGTTPPANATSIALDDFTLSGDYLSLWNGATSGVYSTHDGAWPSTGPAGSGVAVTWSNATTFDFGSASYSAFGMTLTDWGETSGLSISLRLENGDEIVVPGANLPSTPAASGNAFFLGFTSDMSFSSVTFYGLGVSPNRDGAGIDGVLAGNAPVPEPASMTLLGLGLAGLGFRRFRKRG